MASSYAEAAASGPSQSPEESFRFLLQELQKADRDCESGLTIGAEPCDISPNYYCKEDKLTGAQARAPPPPVIEHKQEVHTSSLIDVDSPHVISVPSDYSGETSTQIERETREFESEVRKFEQATKKEAQKLREKARKGEEKAWKNKENPVVVGNAAVLGIGAIALGWGAYVKYSKNELTGKLVGLWAAGLTAFAIGDFYTSQWLFKNKYPTK